MAVAEEPYAGGDATGFDAGGYGGTGGGEAREGGEGGRQLGNCFNCDQPG